MAIHPSGSTHNDGSRGNRGMPLKEINNHLQGRSGGQTLKHGGPISINRKNKTMSGGINRATKGKS